MKRSLEFLGFPNHQIFSDGRVYSIKKQLFLVQATIHGYPSVTLHFKGISKDFDVHRLVALAFIPNPDNKPEANHVDGNKLNNDIENLEWCTRVENMQHSYSIGLRKVPLTEEDVRFIRKEGSNFKLITLGERFGVDYSTIGDILNGTSYSWVK